VRSCSVKAYVAKRLISLSRRIGNRSITSANVSICLLSITAKSGCTNTSQLSGLLFGLHAARLEFWVSVWCIVDRWTGAMWHLPTVMQIRTVTSSYSQTLPNKLQPVMHSERVSSSASTCSTRCGQTLLVGWCHRSTSCFWRHIGVDADAMHRRMAEPALVERLESPSASDKLQLTTWRRNSDASVKWYHFQWPWTNPNLFSRLHHFWLNISQTATDMTI